MRTVGMTSKGAATLDPDSIMFPQVVKELVEILGAGLTAIVANVGETRRVRLWMENAGTPSMRRQQIIRFALRVALILSQRHTREIAQAWFQGLNRHLGDEVPALLLRNLNDKTEDPDLVEVVEAEKRILAAARNFAER